MSNKQKWIREFPEVALHGYGGVSFVAERFIVVDVRGVDLT
jgi:hypothetical protein